MCIYFVTPNGHGLKSIDLVCMKKLDSKVNIIPVIAKADTINKKELAAFKNKIMSELINNGVHIYQFPTSDETVAETNKAMNALLPFAVVGSNDFVKVLYLLNNLTDFQELVNSVLSLSLIGWQQDGARAPVPVGRRPS